MKHNGYLVYMRYAILLVMAAMYVACDSPDTITVEDYQRAEKFLAVNTSPLVYGAVSAQSWQNNDVLLYRTSVAGGFEFKRANPLTKEITTAFDHDKFASSLATVTGKEIKSLDLPITQLVLSDDGGVLTFTHERKRYQIKLNDFTLSETNPLGSPNEFVSPNGALAAYIKDYNLWVRDLTTGKSTQLTFDGKEDYGYATNNAGWSKRDSPVLLW